MYIHIHVGCALFRTTSNFITSQVIWKALQQSARDHGTLGYFVACNTVTTDPKKAVDANLEFLDTVFKGHFLASACSILGVTKPDSKLQLPPGVPCICTTTAGIHMFFGKPSVVEECTLIDTSSGVAKTDDRVFQLRQGAVPLRSTCTGGT